MLRLQRWVLWSGKFPPCRWIYVACYRASGLALRLAWRLRFPLIRSISVHRGLNQPDWVPGASDIDLRIVIKPCALLDEQEFLRAFWGQYAAAKRVLPFLGEVQIINDREAAFVKAHGGARERGSSDVHGAGPSWRLPWERLNESIASCLFLLEQAYFSLEEESSADYGFKVFKGYLDTSRYAAASREGGPVPARRAQLQALKKTGLHDLLADPSRIRQAQALDLCSHALQELDEACREFIAAAEREGLLAGGPAPDSHPWVSDLPNSELFVWQNRMKTLEQDGFPKVHGLYYEGMYRWLVAADVSDRPALKRLFQHLRVWHRQDSVFQNPPSLISRPILQILFWSGYLDTPFLYYSFCSSLNPHSLAARLRGRSPLLGWGQRAQWKLSASDFAPPPEALLRAAFGRSVSNLALSLRLFGLDGWAGNNAYRVGLLYSRLLSAHLYQEKRVISDPDDMDRLIKDYEAHLPEYFSKLSGPLLEDLRRTGDDFNELSPRACFHRHYPSYRMILDRLLDGLPETS